jgi:hypothetical protein
MPPRARQPSELTVRPVPPSGLTVYRVVATDDRDSEAFTRSFMSNHEQGKPPRPNSPEEHFTLIHQAISVFERRYQAEAKARQWSIGDYVARLPLPADAGLCVARWGSKGHLSLWGETLMLAQLAADIVRVSEN